MLAESSVKNCLHWKMKKTGWIRFCLKDNISDIYSYTFNINFQENAELHFVNGGCGMEALKDSGIEVDFLSWMDVLNDVHVLKHLVSRNFLKFVQTSLLMMIEQYLKKRRMLFIRGILSPVNVRYAKK